MNLDDDKRRAQIAAAVTLLVHAVVLLIPITVKIASDNKAQPVEVKGYYTGLVDLSGSPDGQPGFGIPGSGHEGGGSTITVAENIKETPSKQNANSNTAKAEANQQIKIRTGETFGPSNKQPKEVTPKTAVNSKNDTIGEVPKGSKDISPATSGTKGGAGTGSGTGIGSGVGSGSGKGEGTGSGSGTGFGENPGPGSGPPRKGLGIGQGNVSLGPPPVYPKNAQNNGVTGKNRYRVVVKGNAKVNVTCLQSSGDSSLDNSSLRTLLKRWKYPSLESSYYFEVEFVFISSSNVAKIYFIKEGWEDGKP